MTKKELDDLKLLIEQMPEGNDKLQKLFTYYDEMAEYWDNKVGKTSDDDKCTRQWEKYCNLRDEIYNQLHPINANRIIKKMILSFKNKIKEQI